MAIKDTDRTARANYKKKVVTVRVELYGTDEDIREHIEKLKEADVSVQGYIKDLIRADLNELRREGQAYPIIITQDAEFYVVHVPDFDIGTQGESLAGAMRMARDAIEMVGNLKLEEGQTIPEPSLLDSIEAEKDALVTLVDVSFKKH